MPKKYLSMLGLARRAGKLSMGHDMAMNALRNHSAQLIILQAIYPKDSLRNLSMRQRSIIPLFNV